MFSRFRGKLSGLVIGLLIGAVAIVGAVAVPATAQPVATASQSLAQQVRQALGLGQRAARSANVANRRAIGAIRLARRAQGQAGSQGPQGPEGPTGPTGPQGADGEDGSDGADGEQGPQGPPGPSGDDGNTVLSGTSLPTSADGDDGDFYIRTTTSEIWGPKGDVSSGSWGGTGPTELKGPQGDPGQDGDPWTPDNELPAGASLTGSYSASTEETAGGGLGIGSMDEGDEWLTPVSFVIPADPAPSFVFVPGPVGGGFGSETTGTGDLTDGDSTVQNVANAGDFTPGSKIVGNGIPNNTTIDSVDDVAETITLSNNATASGTGVDLTANPGCPGVSGAGIPQADSGVLCAYGLSGSLFGNFIPTAEVKSIGPDELLDAASPPTPAGSLFNIQCNDGGAFAICTAKGVWAVTA